MELIKHRVAHYWSHRAEAFEAQKLHEFGSEKRARWLAEFSRYLPQGRPLRPAERHSLRRQAGRATGRRSLPVKVCCS